MSGPLKGGPPLGGETIHSLTSLRWFSAMYVYLYHIAIRIPVFPQSVTPVIENGYAGMTFFFVLSGYVLTIRYMNEEVSPGAFYVGRFARIYPAYIVAFLLSIPLIKSPSLIVDVVNVVSSVFLLTAWTPNLFDLGINGGIWSLSVEMFFYGLFPALLPIALRVAANPRLLGFTLVSLWLASFLPGVTELIKPVGRTGMFFYYSSPIYRLPEFAVGILLAAAGARYRLLQPTLATLMIAFVFFVGSCYLYNGMASQNLTLLNISILPLVGALLLYVAQRRPAFLECRTLVYLGNISYGFYIFQFIFFGYIYPYVWEKTSNGLVVLVCGLVIVTSLAAASHSFLEVPMRSIIKRMFLRRAPAPARPV